VGNKLAETKPTDARPSAASLSGLPFQRMPALSRVAGPLDVPSHARLAARLVAAPQEAEADLAALRIESPASRAVADALVMEVLATDPQAAAAWRAAFERELARYG
jgi:hypothetical protein